MALFRNALSRTSGTIAEFRVSMAGEPFEA